MDGVLVAAVVIVIIVVAAASSGAPDSGRRTRRSRSRTPPLRRRTAARRRSWPRCTRGSRRSKPPGPPPRASDPAPTIDIGAVGTYGQDRIAPFIGALTIDDAELDVPPGITEAEWFDDHEAAIRIQIARLDAEVADDELRSELEHYHDARPIIDLGIEERVRAAAYPDARKCAAADGTGADELERDIKLNDAAIASAVGRQRPLCAAEDHGGDGQDGFSLTISRGRRKLHSSPSCCLEI